MIVLGRGKAGFHPYLVWLENYPKLIFCPKTANTKVITFNHSSWIDSRGKEIDARKNVHKGPIFLVENPIFVLHGNYMCCKINYLENN